MTPALTEDAAGPDTFVKGRRTGSFQANHCHTNKPTHTDTSATRARTFVRLAFITYQPLATFSVQPIIARHFSQLHREGT